MLVRRGGGRIINIGSVAGRHGGADGLAYAASKAGIEGMTRRLAIDVGRHGVTANVIAPGVITHEHPRQLGRGARRPRRRRPRCRHVEREDGLADPGRPARTARRGGRRRRCSWPATRPPTSPARCCTSTAGGTRPDAARPAGRQAPRGVDRRRLRRPLPLDGHVRARPRRATCPGASSAPRSACPGCSTCSRGTTCAPRGARRRTRCRPSPRQCRADRRRRPRDRRARLLPRAGAEARRGGGAAADGAADRRARAAASAAGRAATGRRRGTSPTPRSGCSRSSGSCGTRR